jgi:23S rRNA (cytidine1920-2'-O)/16S rRNA (cytidine1409-2'-O)-methyltransferase
VPAPRPGDPSNPYVSRGGLKLAHALSAFSFSPAGLRCADLGCSTGGFTDCLLQAGAAHVYAVDTAYGQLAWKLRQDPRVTVVERANALHVPPPEEPVDLVVADLGWTPQRLLIPAALRWLTPAGRIISLIKPHYELRDQSPTALPRGGILDEARAQQIVDDVIASLPPLGVRTLQLTRSPILGGQHKGKGSGNAEWLVLLERGE